MDTEIERLKVLIIELANALEKRIARSGNQDFTPKRSDIDQPLIQRAREAVK